MSDSGARFEAEFDLVDSDNDVQRFVQQIEESLERAFSNASQSFQRDMKKAIGNVFGGGQAGGRSGFDDLGKSTGRLNTETMKVNKSLEAMQKRVEGLERQFKDTYDPGLFEMTTRAIGRLDAQQERLADTTRELTEEQRRLEDVRRRAASSGGFLDVNQQFAALQQARIGADLLIADQRRITREQDRESKERIVLAQQEGSRTLAEIRASSARRVALIQTANQQIRALERGLGSVFRATANTISAAFRGVGGALTPSVSRIRTDTQRINTELTRNFTTSLTERETRMSRSFRNQENTVRTSVSRQVTQLDRLERRMSTGVFGAAAGRSAGASAVGFPGLAGIIGGGGLAGLLGAGFQRFGELERLNKQFLALTGSIQTTETLMAQIKQFAAITPFDLVGVADLAKGFLAIGTAAEDVLPMVKTVADAVALTGGGTDELTRIQRAIGQVVSAGRLQGDELNQLAENLPGLNIRQILADQLTGGNVAALVELQESGKLTADQFVSGLMAGLGGDPRLQGAAEQLASTLSGRFANLKEQFADFGASIIGLVAKPMAQLFGQISTGLSRMSDFIKGENLTPFLETLRIAAAGAAAALGGLVVAKAAGEALKFLGLALRAVLTPMGLFVTIVAGVGAAVAVLAKRSPAFAEALRAVGETLGKALGIIRDVAGTLFGGVTKALGVSVDSIGAFGDFLAEKIQGINRILERFVNDRLRPILEGVVDWVRGTAVPALQTAFGAVAGFVSNTVVPGLVTAFGFIRDVAGRVFGAIGGFITDTIAPGVVTGFRFIRDEVLPVIADTAIKIGGYVADVASHIDEFAVKVLDFVRANDELFATLTGAAAGFAVAGPVGAGLGAGLGLLISNFEKVVPVVQPAIDAVQDFLKIFRDQGLGAAIANLGSGILDSLGNVGEIVSEALSKAFDAIKNFFSPDRLKGLAFGFLDLVEEIGRIIGSIVTNPKFVAGVAGLVGAFAAAAALIVFRFGEGLVRGIGQNLDRWVKIAFSGLTAALLLAFKTAVSKPLLFAGILGGLLAGSRVLSMFRRSGEQAGSSFASGLKSKLAGGAFGGGGSQTGGAASTFLSSLFGGEAGIKRQADKIGQAAARGVAAQKPILLAAGRSLGDGSKEAVNRAYAQLEKDIGPSGIAGLRMRTAIQRTMASVFGALGGTAGGARQAIGAVTQSIGNVLQTAVGNVVALFRTNPQLKDFKSVAQVAGENAGVGLREGLRNSMRTIGEGFAPLRAQLAQLRAEKGFLAAGVAIGQSMASGIAAGFAGFAAGRAAAQTGSGIDTLLAIVGVTATTFTLTGSPIIAGITAAMATIGAALGANAQEAKKAAAEVREYSDALEGITSPAERSAALIKIINENLKDEQSTTLTLLDDLGFGVKQFADAAIAGEPAVRNYVASLLEGLGPAGERLAGQIRKGELSLKDFNTMVNTSGVEVLDLRLLVEDLGIDWDTFKAAMDAVTDENNELNQGIDKNVALLRVQDGVVGRTTNSFGRHRTAVDDVDSAYQGLGGSLFFVESSLHGVDSAFQGAGSSLFAIKDGASQTTTELHAVDSAFQGVTSSLFAIGPTAEQVEASFETTKEAAERLKKAVDDTKQAILDFFNEDYADDVAGLLNDITIAIPKFGDDIVKAFEDKTISDRVRNATINQIQDAFREGIEADITTLIQSDDFQMSDIDAYISGVQAEIQVALSSGDITADTATRLNMLLASVTEDPEFRQKLDAAVQAIADQAAADPATGAEVGVGVKVRPALIPEVLTPEERNRRIRSAIQNAVPTTGGTVLETITVPVGVRAALVPEVLSAEERRRRIKAAIERAQQESTGMGFASGAGGEPVTTVDATVAIRPQFTVTGGVDLKAVGATLVSNLVAGIRLASAQVGVALQQTVSTGAVARLAPQLFQVGRVLVSSLTGGVASGAQAASNTLARAVTGGIGLIAKYYPALIEVGRQLVKALASGIRASASGASNTLVRVVTAGIGGLSRYYQPMFVVGQRMAQFLVAGIGSQYGAAQNAGYQLGLYAYRGALGFTNGMFNIGVNIGYAMARGIYSTVNVIARAAQVAVLTAIAAARAVAAIGSPSRVFVEMGSFMGEGLAIGIESAIDRVRAAASQMTNDAIQVVAAVETARTTQPVTGGDVRNIVEASGGTNTTNVSLVVEGNIYGDAALDDKMNAVLNQIGQAVATRPRFARAGG